MNPATPHSRPPRSERGRVSWIALVVLAALAAGMAAWTLSWRAATPGEPAVAVAPEPEPALDDTSDAVIDQALAQIPVDSTEIKNRWMDAVKDVDVAVLAPAQLERFVRLANAQHCTCGCGFTLAACRVFDPTCPVSLPRLEELRDSVRAGGYPNVDHLRARPSAPEHDAEGRGPPSGS